MKAKPFIKWVGGKSQLLNQLVPLMPKDLSNCPNLTYIEPFVGGGAMLFHVLQLFPNITKAVINDINPDLTGCYQSVKEEPELLIERLSDIEQNYLNLESEEKRKDYYLQQRAL